MMALDLPGHGGSTIPGPEVKTDIEYVMGKLNKFLDLVGVSDRKVHIAGSSLGGAISGIFAAHHPERVEKVSIICPPMETPVNSAFLKELKQAMALEPESLTFEHCSLLPQDLESTKKMFDLCTYNKVSDKLNDQIWKGFLLLRLNRNDFNLRMFKNLANYDYLNLLTSLAPEIKVPSQLIWGQDDAVTHMSGAEVLQSKLPNCRHVDILEQCGHAIDIDRPGALCKALSKFIKEDVDASSEVTTLRSSWKKEDKKGK
ncbi:monoacylglycerol lipase abhd6-A [Aplysia californica]|uniref:acylglycerol lipase n=1 Tax=Aplysia californica TaxID=6500 RepID=A0ABM0K846_APLCA|nr:monoacylglycerol lipase abhd6-A [Aplysia californica]